MSVSKLVTTMLRHDDQDERQRDGSRRWASIIIDESVCTKKEFETLMMDIGDA